jgi:hypothetical protein
MAQLLCFTPAESKRLIAMAVKTHPLVVHALREGNILISNGTTTGYCARELVGTPDAIERKPLKRSSPSSKVFPPITPKCCFSLSSWAYTSARH